MEELMAIQLPEDYWEPDTKGEQIEKPKPKPMISYSCEEEEEELMAIQLPEDYWQPDTKDEQIEEPIMIYSCEEGKEIECVDEHMVNEYKRKEAEYNRQEAEYNRQVSESDGFDVDCFDGPFVSIMALGNAETATTFCPLKDLASAALDEFNQKNNTNMEFVKALKVNAHLCKGLVYYVTFEVRDPTDDQIKIFQAKVWHFPLNEPPIEVLLCRKKPGTV